MKPDKDVNFRKFLDCVSEIFNYVNDPLNWHDPLLPQQPGCPALESDNDYLKDEGTGWRCVDAIER